MLCAFTKAACSLLKPGGKYIGINESPFVTRKEDFEKTHKYGVLKLAENDVSGDGDKLVTKLQGTFKGEDWDCVFDNFYWSQKTLEEAFTQAGFEYVHWITLVVAPEELEKDKEYWEDW